MNRRCLLLLAGLLGCDRAAPDGAAQSSSARPRATSAPAVIQKAPRPLLELASSPYQARLMVRAARPELLTADALYRFDVEGTRSSALSASMPSTLNGSAVLRWFEGALQRLDDRNDSWSTLLVLPRPPRSISASGAGVAWQTTDGGASVELWMLTGSEPRRVATAPTGVATMALADDRLFFVEELAASRWRLGVVSASGEPARYGRVVVGRPPAMLAVTSDVFYYDGPTLSVYRVSTDLQRTERVGSDVICSPLAVATSVYCSQPGAVIELPLSGGQPKLLASPQGTVTALAVAGSELVWLREARGGGLLVESVDLAASAR